MEKRPILLRTIIAIFVVAMFVLAVYPLRERDYYEVFMSLLRDKNDEVAKKLVDDARNLQRNNPQMFQSQALLQAADANGVVLSERLEDPSGLTDNRDVMSLIRKKASGTIRLGLDLAGGVEFYLELVPDENFLAKIKADGKQGESREQAEARLDNQFNYYRDVAIEILRKRLESQKIFEAEISPSGSRYVSLRAPVVAKDEKLKLLDLIRMSAKLKFRLVHPDNDAMVRAYRMNPDEFQIPIEYELMKTTDFRKGQAPEEHLFFVAKQAEMEGKDITYAVATKDEFGQRRIQLRFNLQGAEDFGRVTAANVGRSLAIVLDGQLCCAPRINGAITGGSAEITGRFSEEEAKNIADALVSGSFPFQIKVNAVFDTDPKLGAANISNGIWVGALSLLCVALFMLLYYRSSGFVAIVALSLNIVLILGAMAAFNCTLTLPGIAGIVLTIGMAVDANVLVYERIREEIEAGKKLRHAVDLGYGKALSAVLDANITTLLTSFILMYVGTGAVKGFAVTLSIGILTSLFTALFVTRLIFDVLFNYTRFSKMSMLSIFRNTKYDFIRWYRISGPVAAIAVAAALAIGCIRGTGMLGVDFTGGTVVTFNYAEQVDKEKIESVLAAAGYDEPSVTYKFNIASGNGERKMEILVRGDLTADNAGRSPKDVIGELLNSKFPNAKFEGGIESSVGGLIGWEFTKAAMWAIALSLVGIGIYITLRYEHTYAVTGVLMLVLDVAVVMGIYLALGRMVSLTVVAAVLTIIGYSINDKVVIFDRIRENIRLAPEDDFGILVNRSVNETLSRTMLTSVTTFIVVFILFLGGGVAINDFVMIMMLGVIFGTCSSIFVAGPFLTAWHRRIDARKKNRK
ncbi:MAG: protein translocase subunit SecD [Victivallaceae bacterium]|nr:protein translocase subunit SecD [Victivallaceae bacterium]